MTAQIPEKLINDCQAINISGLNLYYVLSEFSKSERIGKPYQLTHRASKTSSGFGTALRRGYVSCYRLTHDGRLILEAFEYPKGPAGGVHEFGNLFGTLDITAARNYREQVSETLVGDFWLVLGSTFFGSRTYIPFRNGIVITNQSDWIRD